MSPCSAHGGPAVVSDGTKTMTMLGRVATVAVTFVLAVGLVIAGPVRDALAFQGATAPSPLFTKAGTMKLAPKVFGWPGLALTIGWAGWEAYQWQMDCDGFNDCFNNGAKTGTYATRTAEYNNPSTSETGWGVAQYADGTWTISGGGSVRPYNSSTSNRPTQISANGNELCQAPAAYTSCGGSLSTDQAWPSGSLFLWGRAMYGTSSWYPRWTAEFSPLTYEVWSPSHPSTQTQQRQGRVTATQQHPDGSTSQVEFYGEPSNDPNRLLRMPPGKVDLPLKKIEFDIIPKEGDGEIERIWEWERDAEPLTEVETEFPNCQPPNECDLEVEHLNDQGEWEKANKENGKNWWKRWDRFLRFRCKWGEYVLPLEQCQDLARMWDFGTEGQTTAPTSLFPPTSPAPTPTIIPTQPIPEIIPTTGIPQTPIPTIQGSSTGTGSSTTGSGSSAGTAAGTLLAPVPDGGDGECFPTGWGLLNPVEWVLKPTKCALEWAFVPSQATMDAFTASAQTTTQKAPFGYVLAGASYLEDMGSGGSTCWAPSVNLNSGWLGATTGNAQQLTLFNSCDSGNAVIATMQQLRPLLTAMLYAGLLIPLAWWAWRAYAPGTTSAA